ncbi:MAG: hypothetical protein FWD48_11210, partial [Oscillospiraceae bacterium]|nr:hypothetical protein [Oscillospiraceae bacterium]
DETSNSSIALHTDDDGKRSWVIPNMITNGEISQWRLGLFDFTDDYISEFVKFSHSYHADDLWERFDFVYNEQELFLTPEEIQEYDIVHQRYLAELAWYENDYDDYIENSEKEFYTGEGLWEEGVFPPGYFAFFPTLPPYSSVGDKYNKIKRLFEYSLIPSAYKLDPNRSWGENGRDWCEMDSDQFEKSLHRLITAYFTDDKGYLSDPLIYSIGAYAKPVVYLYPEEITDVEVRVTFPRGGYFTATYPDYGDGWSVTAHPDGTLFSKADNREYQYLYWAGRGPANWDFSSGFVVKGSDTIEFFQEKLAYLGLIPREYNEFIVYYLPLMQNNAYNLITFQTTVYEENAAMHISPKPDSIQRIFMAFMPLEAPVNIPEQQLEPFERTGFAVIEWGGTEVKLQ